MRKVLFILSQFRDQDIDWLTGAGVKEQVESGTTLVHLGKPIDHLYMILQGSFDVTSSSAGTIASLGSGEIVGEVSFLDSRPPTANVVASDQSVVLAISKKRLNTKLRTDDAFASRFYHALGIMLADRLRGTTALLGQADEADRLNDDVEHPDEVSPEALKNSDLAAARFNRILEKLL